MIAFEKEIPSFWMTKSGHRYFELNRRLISNQVEVKRIYVFDFAWATEAPEMFRTMVHHLAQQVAIGVKCRGMDQCEFSETLKLNCALFGVQDEDNVALFAPDELSVTLVREHDHVTNAIDVYEDLFASPTCHSVNKLLRYSRSL